MPRNSKSEGQEQKERAQRSPGALVLRADASVEWGSGHVMRCLALAQVWQDGGGDAVFAMSVASSASRVEERLRDEGFSVARVGGGPGDAADAEETAALARRHNAAWVVVDGYRFGAEYQECLKNSGLKVLFVDDNGHAGSYVADLVLNQNLHARGELYSRRNSSTRLLLGSRFAMLRREFNSWREWKRETPGRVRRILVTMGGSDPNNVTLSAAEAVLSAGDFELTIVAGGSNPNLAGLREFARSAGGSVKLVENASNMPELIAAADLAVAGAGTTAWEICFLGLPALLVVLAANQQGVADELGRQGIMMNLGPASELRQESIFSSLRSLAASAHAREEMSARGRALVDGHGAERVVSVLRRESIFLRPIESADCKLLWEWANDPAVRASAFSSEAIPWNEHVAWFRARLGDLDSRLFIGSNAAGVPVGQIRFDKLAAGDADVDVSVDVRYRGLGYASRMIELGVERVFAEGGIRRINAFVKSGNAASARAFEVAGFTPSETVTVRGQTAVHYLRTAA